MLTRITNLNRAYINGYSMYTHGYLNRAHNRVRSKLGSGLEAWKERNMQDEGKGEECRTGRKERNTDVMDFHCETCGSSQGPAGWCL